MSGERRFPRAELPPEIAAQVERTLTAEEFDAWVNAPWDPRDLEETLAQIAWFRRRYPTADARLSAGRRAWLQVKARLGR